MDCAPSEAALRGALLDAVDAVNHIDALVHRRLEILELTCDDTEASLRLLEQASADAELRARPPRASARRKARARAARRAARATARGPSRAS